MLALHAAAASERCKADVAKTMKVNQMFRALLPGASVSLYETALVQTCRDNVYQLDTHVRLRESKSQARAAMTGMAKQLESHRALEKQLIRARADHDELVIDGKEVSHSVC